MAPSRVGRSEDLSNCPFADYFWIAGLDGQELLDTYRAQTSLLERNNQDLLAERRRSALIHEETLTEEDEGISDPISPTVSRRSKTNSWDRLSKLSGEARRSIQSIDELASFGSNRSSATIRAIPPSPSHRISSAVSEADFNNALKKFATDRDTFFLDLSFKDATPQSSPQRSRPSRTQRIVPEELETVPNRNFGSVRRHMSFREMNSAKRQPSVVRRTSTRTSRRMSSYNAVVPKPEVIQSSPHQHPLRRSFEPVLLDRFPPPEMTDEMKRRDAFPDYVPMFAFPNDIHIISSDTRPPSTWHEFAMTAADNSKTPAVCVIIWIPMSQETANELEKLCEEWRKANMTDAEREMAASLAERLAMERANLSRLLARLPHNPSGSDERNELEDQISTVEERIGLMSDMLKPLRHGAANRIDGLTDGDSGIWIPRAYGLLGRDNSLPPVWKEWLKAVVTPMLTGSVLHVPASSPRIGMWQPLERYVFNICCEALRPVSSSVQTELSVRELRLYAKKEAVNELPGSRSTDLYPLFRALTIPNIMVLFEYLLAEARIILVSSHAAMLKLVSKALLELLWPLEWAGVYIPVLPARLTQVLEAPCPYICGVVRKNSELNLPEDDFVMVDLDKDELHATDQPPPVPKQHRRKLMSLLYMAAPHHHSRGVPVGPPLYTMQTFPNSMFVSENTSIFTPAVVPSNLVKLASLSSSMYGTQAAADQTRKTPVLNAFSQAGFDIKSMERPTTASTARQPSHHESDRTSPVTANFPPMPRTPSSRNDPGYNLQIPLREKRSGYLDSWSKKGDNHPSIRRKPSLPFVRHNASPSTISISPLNGSVSTYAPSSYTQSTLAASTIMPGLTFQPALNSENMIWMEGHCMQRQTLETRSLCSVCYEKVDGGNYHCSGCHVVSHGACATQISVVCQAAFYPDQIRVAFARFFTSLFYSYRKFVAPVDAGQRKLGMACKIKVDAWTRSLPSEHATYLELLRQTQAFNEFVSEREQVSASSSDSVMLFDALIMAKRRRSGRMRSGIGMFGRNPFATKSPSGTSLDFMADTTSHAWRLASTPMSTAKPDLGEVADGRDYRAIITRTPAKLEKALFPRIEEKSKKEAMSKREKASLLRKMNGLSMNAPENILSR